MVMEVGEECLLTLPEMAQRDQPTRAARASGWCRWEQMKGAGRCVCALEVKPSDFLFCMVHGAFTNKTWFLGLDSLHWQKESYWWVSLI